MTIHQAIVRPIHPLKDAALARLKGMRPGSPAAVKLHAWMVAHGMTVREFSMYICMGHKTLATIMSGRRDEQLPLYQAFAIEWATAGHVQAWEWLDNRYTSARVRKNQLSAITDYQRSLTQSALRTRGGGDVDGVLRQKARALSRLYGVKWAEAKRRAWLDARATADWETADVSHLMNGSVTDG